VSLRDPVFPPPFLSVYVNDMPTIPKAKIALFADDIIVYAASKHISSAIKILQSQIYIAIQWFHEVSRFQLHGYNLKIFCTPSFLRSCV